MPGALVDISVTATCPHGGIVAFVAVDPRVTVGGMPVITVTDASEVLGCTFLQSGIPHPCVRVQWLAPAVRVLVLGQPAVLQTSPGLCSSADGTPQGPAEILAGQVRVVGT